MSKPSLSNSSRFPVYQTARSYLAAGLSMIPLRVDGSKAPALDSWAKYQHERAKVSDLRDWFRRPDPPGIGIVTGPLSGNLVVLDFDDRKCYDAWRESIANPRPELWQKLVRVATPSGGRHVYFRTKDPALKLRYPHLLAARPIQQSADQKQKVETMCELKVAGRYLVAPGSPAACHPEHRVYRELADTTITQAKCLSAKSIDFLLQTAQQFDERPPRRYPKHPSRTEFHQLAVAARGGNRPGDEFEVIMNWDEILEPAGWHYEAQHGAIEYWCRPGKTTGISASVNFAESGLLYVFSTNAAPLEDGRAYTKFAAYATLNHDGDFSAAASALRRQGFGSQTPTKESLQSPRRWEHLRGLLHHRNS